MIYIDFAKTGEKLSLIKVCHFLHCQFAQNLNVQHLINLQDESQRQTYNRQKT